MGTHNKSQGHNLSINMLKCTLTKLMLAALFLAIATASSSDLEPTSSDIVPESDFLQSAVDEDAFVETEADAEAKHWTDCKLGVGDCAKPTIYTASRVCEGKKKKDCQYMKKQINGKWVKATRCSKWNKKACDEWGGYFNVHAKVNLHMPRPKFCHEMTSEDGGVCRCAGAHQDWKGKGKPCFMGPNKPETKVCRNHKDITDTIKPLPGQPARKLGKVCTMEKFKQGPWTPGEKLRAACNAQGYAFARTCAYPPGVARPKPKKPKKKCECKVKGYNKSWTLKVPTGNKAFSWYKKNRGLNKHPFDSIECDGCLLVTLHDDDKKTLFQGKDDVHLGCCKGCKYVAAHNGFDGKKKANTWDLHNDVKQIDVYNTFKHHKC